MKFFMQLPKIWMLNFYIEIQDNIATLHRDDKRLYKYTNMKSGVMVDTI